MMSGRSRSPFTVSQWQELEHQALIFKYMVSGMPIPPDLLFTIKRSGWNYLQMGLGRKIDPEPGRCRRTDGKKWRCSRDAYPDSKYCERHMHRGKNRSRKPVEAMTPPTPTKPPPALGNCLSSTLINLSSNSPTTTHSHSLPPFSSLTDHETHHQNLFGHHHRRFNNTHFQNHFIYPPHSSSSRPPPVIGIDPLSPPQDNTTHLLLNSASCAHTDPDYNRYIHGGPKEEVDESAFFTENSRTTMRSFTNSSIDDPLRLTPLTMSSYSKQSASSVLEHSRGGGEFYNHLQLQSLAAVASSKQQQQQKQNLDQNCYLLGRDLKGQTPSNIESREEEQKKGIHHHFLEEWAPKSRDSSWLNTQLSISIPDSSHDFPIFNSRTHNDGLSFQ